MPAIQILPQGTQSFGSQLGQALGTGTGQGLSQALTQHLEMRTNRKSLEALSPIFEQAGFGQEEIQKLLESGMRPEQALEVAKLSSTQKASQQQDQGLQTAAKALTDLEDLVSEEGIGFLGTLNPSAKARQNRGRFKATQAAILPLFKSMFPRGMTEKEFKFIQENYIPQSHDSEEKIKGKIDGLKQLFPGDSFNKPAEQLVQEEGSLVRMQTPDGKLFLVPKNKALEAQRAGGKLVK